MAFLPVDPGVLSHSVFYLEDSGVVAILVVGLSILPQEQTHGAGREWLEFLAIGEVHMSESTTSITHLKFCFFPIKPIILVYIGSLSSNSIFLVFNNFFFLVPTHPPPIGWTSRRTKHKRLQPAFSNKQFGHHMDMCIQVFLEYGGKAPWCLVVEECHGNWHD